MAMAGWLLWALAGALSALTGGIAGAGVGHGDLQYVAHCRIFNQRGELLKLAPGSQCLFFRDGSYLSVDPMRKVTVYVDRRGQEIWKRTDLALHHGLNLSSDGKRVLTVKSDVAWGDCGRVRYDGFEILDLATGRSVASWSLRDHLEEVREKSYAYRERVFAPDVREQEHADCEVSHFNSLHEIPANPIARKNSAFSPGNQIAGLNHLNSIVIFDAGLKRILWAHRSADLGEIHDVQVLSSGKILIYNNEVTSATGRPRLAIQILNPLNRKLEFSFQPGLSPEFRAPIGGGVQWLADGFLFSSNGEGRAGRVYFVSHLDHQIKWWFNLGGRVGAMASVLTCKQYDLREFLLKTSL